MRRNGYLWTSGVNFRHHRSIRRPRVPIRMPIRSWFMKYNVFHCLPLKMRTRPLRMRRITWPVSTGSKTITFLESRPRFASSLCNFGGSTMNIIKVICENNARPCVKKTYEILRMREITWSVKGALNVLLQSFSTTSIYSIGLQKLSI